MVRNIKKIILVDDDGINNLVNKEIIRQFNASMEILVFQESPKALQYLRENTNLEDACIFLDINMPVMNGWEFLQSLRNLSLKVPVIILTSSVDEYDQEVSKKYAEVKAHLYKPLSKNKIQEVFSLL